MIADKERAGISRYGVLLQVQFVDSLLKTSVGKLNKLAMRDRLHQPPVGG